jgi:NAD+-dependent secondary alcohol dehydrogenase Adh1
VAALADAGLTAYHAVRRALPELMPGTTGVILGAGGLGHVGVRCVLAMTAATVIVVDRNPAALGLIAGYRVVHPIEADGPGVAPHRGVPAGGRRPARDDLAAGRLRGRGILVPQTAT